MEEVEESINHLKTLASIMNPPLFARFERLESERRARQDELASNLDVSDDLADYPVNLLPMAHLSAVFQGREEVLVQIDEALDGPESELRSVLIHGLGGVGKTQTALNYAHRNAAKYDAIFWVRSETTLSINASMSNIARSLKLPGSMREDGNDEMNFLMVQSWFRTQAARKKG
jgi:predicted ATP-dependent serine protease